MVNKTISIAILFCIVILFCFTGYAGSDDKVVRIAAVFAKTGPGSKDNIEHLKGVRLAVKEINSAGGVLGRKIELIEFDNESSTFMSMKAGEKAVEEGVAAVIGASWSSHSMALAPVLQKAGIPMLTPASTNPEITRVGNFIFRICYEDTLQGHAIAVFARKDLGLSTAVVLTNTNSLFSIGLAEEFIRHFKEIGGIILYEGDYLTEDTDFYDLIKAIKDLGPHAVFIPGYYRNSALIIKQCKNMGMNPIFIGGDGWTEDMYHYAGELIEGSYFASFWHRDMDNEKSRMFVKNFEREFGRIINSGTPQAYDAVYLFADAVKRANSFDGNAIRAALQDTIDFIGVTGKISFDENGDPRKPVVILRFEKHGIKLVKTINP